MLESNNGLSNIRGSLAMARTNLLNSATSEFYINLVDNKILDYQGPTNPGCAVFGQVISGLDVMGKTGVISVLPTIPVSGFANVPTAGVTLQLALQIK